MTPRLSLDPLAGGIGGDYNLLFTNDYATRLTATVCSKNTDFDARVWIYSSCPYNSSTQALATSFNYTGDDDDGSCSAIYDLHDPSQSLYVIVDGVGPSAEGTFEIFMECTTVPTPSPTSLPTPQPTVSQCGFDPLACDTSLMTTNYNYGSFLGRSGGERNFVINITEVPTRVYATTCDSDTTIEGANLMFYDQCPMLGTMLANNTRGYDCGHAFVDVYEPKEIWLIVDASNFGDFRLNVSCGEATFIPTSAPTVYPTPPACTYEWISCGSSARGTNVGFMNLVGGPGGDVLYRIVPNASTFPLRINADTCNNETDFDTQVWFYTDCPDNSSSRLVVQPETSDSCLGYVEISEAGDLWIAIDGAASNRRGNFRVDINCFDAPTPSPTSVPTSYPTGLACSYTYAECGSTIRTTNRGWKNYYGGPGGDVNILVNVTEATFLYASTCMPGTNYHTMLYLYDTCPETGGSLISAQATSGASRPDCSVLTFRVAEPTEFFLVIDGLNSTDNPNGDGELALNLTCGNPPSVAPTVAPTLGACSFTEILCDSYSVGTTLGGFDTTGNGAPDKNLAVETSIPQYITATACDPKMTMDVTLAIWTRGLGY